MADYEVRPGMNALCGAWALSGGPVAELLSRQDRCAIAAMAGGESGRFEEIISGPLWMAAAPGKTTRRQSTFAGMEGFIAAGPASDSALGGLLESFERDPGFEPRCAGHYVLAFADTGRKRLCLLRDLSGCERLYFTLVDGAAGKFLLFSSSIRPLLAHPAVPRAANPDTILEFGLLGVTLFGDETAFAGIREVLPGHRLDVSNHPNAVGSIRPNLQRSEGLGVSSEGLNQRWYWGQSFEPAEGDMKALGARFWEGLLDSVRGALGTDSEAAVALSGGIDSSTVTAALAEVLGPDRVHAFTFEFEGTPGRTLQTAEVPRSQLVCRHLGIKRHTIKRIGFAEYRKALPEATWLLENSCRHDTIDMDMARLAASHGFAQYFSAGCFGAGADMKLLHASAQAWQASPSLMRNYWRGCISQPWRTRWRVLSALLPDLDTGAFFYSPFLFFQPLCVLRHNGIIDSLSGFFPEPLGSMAEEASESPRIKEAVKQTAGWPLAAQMAFHCYIHLNTSCDARGRPARTARLAGARNVLPFLFPRCLPLAHIPPRYKPPFWDPMRREPPCKLVLREAVRDRLPNEIVSVTPWRRGHMNLDWLKPLARSLEPHLAASVKSLRPMLGGHWDELRRSASCAENLDLLALWHATLIAQPPRPEWGGLQGLSTGRLGERHLLSV